MRITSKMLLPIVAMSLALLAVVGTSLVLQQRMNLAHQRATLISTQSIEASEVRSRSRAIQRDSLKVLSEPWKAQTADLEKSIQARADSMLKSSSMLVALVGPDHVISKDFESRQGKVVQALATARRLAASGALKEAFAAYMTDVEPAEKSASALTDRFIEDNNKLREAVAAEIAALEAETRLLMIGSSLGVALLALLVAGLFAYQSVAAPLVGLARALRSMVGGDFKTALAGINRKDEIGEIAQAVEELKVVLAERAKAELEQQMRDQAEALAEQARVSQERERVAAETTAALEQVGRALSLLAEKDLSIRVGNLPQTYAVLEHSFNTSVEQLAAVMATVRQRSDGVAHGALEISRAPENLSHQTERQAAALEETVAALHEISGAVGQTAELSRHVGEIVSRSAQEATQNQQVVQDAVMAMHEIETSARQVGQIVGVMDEIAFQTNLLALNAGVEAARAGEAGRGFAVVASEVRALAQRSAQAAKEIKDLIASSSRQVNLGAGLVKQTGESLSGVLTQIGQINGLVNDIVAKTGEQAAALKEITATANEMDQITQQNAAMAEESLAVSSSLADESRDLDFVIGEFRIERDSRAAVRRQAA